MWMYLFLLFGVTLFVYPQADDVRSDSAVADRYALWAKNTLEQGFWAEALAALERASDFADFSSDISYLLALTRFHENRPRVTVLEALTLALAVDRWVLYYPEDARLLKIECLIGLRAYSDALYELTLVNRGPKESVLKLKALSASRPWEFNSYMRDTLDRFPRECGPVRLFFDFLKREDAAGRYPGREELEILELIVRRLPLLLPDDPELAWMAAPYMRDNAEAGRLVSAYRAVHPPAPESLPAALKLGVIDEELALVELFLSPVLQMTLLGDVWELLRLEEAKLLFRRNLSVFSGVITEDGDGDGIPEISAEYDRGVLRKSSYDTIQTGIMEMSIFFEAGDPLRALVLIPPESSRKVADLQWERYPAVFDVELEGARYIPRPLDFYYSPVKFTDLWQSGLLFPERDTQSPALTRRVLVSQSLRVERPSLEFSGGIEIVELNQSIPVRAREYVGELMVSETEFLRGRPQLQWVDLDMDGRKETVRRFNRNYRQMELEELWNYDRDYDNVYMDEL